MCGIDYHQFPEFDDYFYQKEATIELPGSCWECTDGPGNWCPFLRGSFACIVRLEHRTGKKVKHG